MIPHAQHHRAQLVGSSHVDTVELAMWGDGIQVNDSGRVNNRQPRLAQPASEASEPTKPAHLVRGCQEGETKVSIRGFDCSPEGKPVSRRPGNEVRDPRVGEQFDEAGRIGQGLYARPATIDIEPTVCDPADVNADGARVDTDDSGHGYLLAVTSSRAISAMASASSTRSFRSKSRTTQALCSLVLKFPTPKAPNTTTPFLVTPASFTSTPSIPRGGTAFRSTATLSVFTPVQADFGTICTPAGPELRRTSTPWQSPATLVGSLRVTASTWTLKRALMNCRAFSPCSGFREVMVT